MITHTLNLSEDRVIHQYWGNASNMYVIETSREGASFLIDCGMPSDVEALSNILQSMPPLKRIVCTHFHIDHVSGWINLKRRFKTCEIWLHEKAAPLVLGQERIPLPSAKDNAAILFPCMKEYGYWPKLKELFNGALYGTPFKKGFPEDRLKFFTDEQQVLPGFITLHTPGHRPDSVSFLDPDSGVLVTGDFIMVINEKVTINSFVSSQKDQDQSVEKVKGIQGVKWIFPGHGICRPFSVRSL